MIIYPLPSGKSEIYEDDLAHVRPSFVPNHKHYADIEIKDFRIVRPNYTAKFIKKQELNEKLQNLSGLESGNGFPYLEHNALTRGDFDIQYKINISSQCQKSVVWFLGQSTGLNYVKKIDCRKQWCPVCGGKGGHIHKNRIHSIIRRFPVDEYNIRQFVLTVPESLRDKLKDRENLNRLFQYSKQLTEKFFGQPIFDRRGHIKKYKLEKGAIVYLHLFGDVQTGVFKPHINIHILEDRSEKLMLSESMINSIKKYWLKKLRNIDELIDVVDVHYKFRIQKAHKLHAIKYMSRPWSNDDFKDQNDDMKTFLAVNLAGFRYIRFWGKLANCNYRDEFDVQEETETCETKCGEKLTPLMVAPFDDDSWKNRMIEIDQGFYLILKKGGGNESAESKAKEKGRTNHS